MSPWFLVRYSRSPRCLSIVSPSRCPRPLPTVPVPSPLSTGPSLFRNLSRLVRVPSDVPILVETRDEGPGTKRGGTWSQTSPWFSWEVRQVPVRYPPPSTPTVLSELPQGSTPLGTPFGSQGTRWKGVHVTFDLVVRTDSSFVDRHATLPGTGTGCLVRRWRWRLPFGPLLSRPGGPIPTTSRWTVEEVPRSHHLLHTSRSPFTVFTSFELPRHSSLRV